MEEEFSFPLERSPAMKLMGTLWTGAVSGQILVGILLLIGIGFMGSQNFSLISIIFFVIFLLPASMFIHFRLVSRGKKLMEGWCDIKFYPESEVLEFKTGFPNTMDPNWQEVKITDNNRDIVIKGGEVGGYHLRLGSPKDLSSATRLGLWIELEDAQEAAEKLSDHLKGDIIMDTMKEKEEREKSEEDTSDDSDVSE